MSQSPLHSASDLRVVKCVDGLYYSFEMLEHVHSDLHRTCAGISGDKKFLIPALWRCWSFVDLVHRIREIAQAMPGLSKKDAELLRFLKATDLAGEYRNYIQHLRSELLKRDIDKFPVWGSLAWVDMEDPNCCHTIMLGARLEGTGYVGCVFDNFEKRWVSSVSLSVREKSFHFDPVFQACNRFRQFIMERAAEVYAGGIEISPTPPVATMRVLAGGQYWGKSEFDQPL